jgi:DNA-binding Lrp family transcriptional regulator
VTRLQEPQPAAAAPRVDAKDRDLIAALESDGRAPAAALAAQVGLSDDAVRERLRRLRESGVLRVLGYADLALRGYAYFSMLALRIHGDVRPTIERLLEIDEIYWLACVDGRFDALAELNCRDTDHLFDVVNAAIRSLDTIASTELFTYLETTKWADAPSVRLPLRHEPRIEPPPPDEIDWRLIAHLERDGRASFRDLAATADVSYDVARRRVTAMLESGAVTPVTVVDRSVTDRARVAIVGIRVSGAVPPVLERVVAVPEVRIAYFATGSFDIVCEIGCSDAPHLDDVVGTRLREIPGVAVTETFNLLRVGRAPAVWPALPGLPTAAGASP